MQRRLCKEANLIPDIRSSDFAFYTKSGRFEGLLFLVIVSIGLARFCADFGPVNVVAVLSLTFIHFSAVILLFIWWLEKQLSL